MAGFLNIFYYVSLTCNTALETDVLIDALHRCLQVNTLDTEEGVDEVIIMGGGRTAYSSYNLARLSGANAPSLLIRSPNNFMIIRFFSDGATQGTGFNMTWVAGENGGGHERGRIDVVLLAVEGGHGELIFLLMLQGEW